MKLFKRREENTGSIDVDAAVEKSVAAKRRLAITLPKVNMLSSFFEERQGKNGFGEDFEWTFEATLDHRPESA